jgi:large subunit ribosomal protein L33
MKKDYTVKMACEKCKRVNHFTRRNKKTVEKKLQLKKFCKWCRTNTVHKEAKK